MITATPEQREQIDLFFDLISNERDSVLLYPIIDEKTGVERLGICVANRETGDIYLLGLWFLPNDSLFKRFAFKDASRFTTEKQSFVRRMFAKVKLLWI